MLVTKWKAPSASAGCSCQDKIPMHLTFLIHGNVVLIICVLVGDLFFTKSVKTAVPGDRNPPRALVLTNLVEYSRCEVGHKKYLLCFFHCVRTQKLPSYIANI